MTHRMRSTGCHDRNDGRCVRAHDTARIEKYGSLGESPPVSAHQGPLQERAEERCFRPEHRFKSPRCPKGGPECSPDPHLDRHRTPISQYQPPLQHHAGKPRNPKKKGKASILFCLKEKTEYCALSIGVIVAELENWPVKSGYHKE